MNRIIVICGPTATGKSALAVKIAKAINGEIISADSRQVYVGLDIGSAKITPAEMQDVPHYLINVANPREVFTVAQFKQLADEKITDIISRGKVPIICGGTGMYISAVIDNQNFPEVPPDPKLRAELEKLSCDELIKKLESLDPVRAATIDRNNPRRLVRAIEVATHLTRSPAGAHPLLEGEGAAPISFNSGSQSSHPSPSRRGVGGEVLIIGLTLPKEELITRIKQRIENRIPALFDEINQLHDSGISFERLESFGLEYRHGSEFVRNAITLEQFKETLATKTWQFAKRQMTWFKRDTRIHWLNSTSDHQKILKLVQDFLK